MLYRYAIIIVTYNRLELLKECLEHAVNQTVEPTNIIVIDNASTDGTHEYLKEFDDNSLVKVVRLPENAGGAGGFCEGVKQALQTDVEWFILIDDDAILDYDCMQKMNPYEKHIPAQAYACVVKEHESIALGHRRNMLGQIKEECYKQEEFQCELATFCGLMVSKELVSKIGLPEKEFFIWFDDTEYSLRIQNHSPIVVYTQAMLNHKTAAPTVTNGKTRLTWKSYYGLRNQIVTLKRHHRWYDLFKTIYRDIIIIIIKLVKAAIRDKECWYEMQLSCRALRDGLVGKLGKNEQYMPGKK